MRLRLDDGYNLAGFTGAARVIAEALKQYGFLVADNGSNWFFGGTSDSRWDDDDLNQLKWIPGSAFEVVRSEALDAPLLSAALRPCGSGPGPPRPRRRRSRRRPP